MSDLSPKPVRISVRRYAAGKAFGVAWGDPAFAEQAQRALQRSLVIDARIDRERFMSMMRDQGVPDSVTLDYLQHAVVDDEAWLQDVWPS